jgi:citrate lyase subunit beta/citryl-CoA lyase
MFVPAHNERLLNSASRSRADVLLLDIEDSVQPVDNKQLGRDNIVKFVIDGKFNNHLVYPRINDRQSGELLKDVRQLTIEGVDGFMYPKAETGEDIYFFGKLLETIEYEKGLPIGTFKIIPLIETASAVMNIQSICNSCHRVVAVAFGCEDFVTDLHGLHDHDGQSIFTARSMIAMGARACNVIPVDTVHINVHDLEDLEKNLILAKNLGFEGMLVLNPKEIPLVHKYFSPARMEVEDAKEMVRLSDSFAKEGKGVAVFNNKFIGPPMKLAAEKLLKRQKLIEIKEKI